MSGDKSFYGTGVPETGRKTWDLEEYRKKAEERRHNEQNQSEKRELKSQVQREDLRFNDDLNKAKVIAGDVNVVGTRGKGVGFYCAVCDLTFKDNLTLVMHYNSPQHMSNANLTISPPSTLEEVRETLKKLYEEKQKLETRERFNIEERIRKRREFEAKEQQARERRRMLRNQKRKQRRKQQEAGEDESGNPSGIPPEMASMMGFSGFGSTKK